VSRPSPLEAAAEAWIADYFNARHLLRTRDWVVELDAAASEALRIAALTHDIERREPGGPELDPHRQAWDDPTYLREHSERSARIVDRWLATQAAPAQLRARVVELIHHHETGGPGEADTLQAADSLSFLEVNATRALAWVQGGRSTPAQARAKLDWMLERIRDPRGRALADPLYRRAAALIT
jgi:hypothetical protein